MNRAPMRRIRLADPENEGRTTATLLASLIARLATLHSVSGSAAIGSLTSGFAALGREVERTAEGARLVRALAATRAGANGDALWKTLKLEEWMGAVPPSPVLDQLRNDLALLLAADLDETLRQTPMPAAPAGAVATAAEDAPATFLHCALGLWWFSRELARGVEALAAPTLLPEGSVLAGAGDEDTPPPGSILR